MYRCETIWDIDITVDSAQLYIYICIQNSAATGDQALPMATVNKPCQYFIPLCEQ